MLSEKIKIFAFKFSDGLCMMTTLHQMPSEKSVCQW